MDSRVVTSVWKQFGKRVESARKDKLIVDGNEIHPSKAILGRFNPSVSPSGGILELRNDTEAPEVCVSPERVK